MLLYVMGNELTDKQCNILQSIKEYINDFGYPPTLQELSQMYSITPNAVKGHLLLIEKKGYIEYQSSDVVKSRAIKVLK